MRSLLKNIRLYVLLFSLSLSLGIFIFVRQTVPPGISQIIHLTQLYALTALSYLYITLLIGPAVYTFRSLPWRGHIYRARRAIGVSTFYFAGWHAYLAFFKQLGGFSGLFFLDQRYLLAISLSFTALIILTLMAGTSFDIMVRKLTFRRWKLLHRFIYLVGVLVLIHALLLGTHFSDLSQPIPQVFAVALAFLLWLQARRVDAWLYTKFPRLPAVAKGVGWVTLLYIGLVLLYCILVFFPAISGCVSLGIHGQHTPCTKSIGLIAAAEAHVLQTDNTVGAVLHISPTDDPIARQPSVFFLEFKDTAGDFTLETCACTASIIQGGREVLQQSLRDNDPTDNTISTTFTWTFPKKDLYHATITGSPLPGSTWQPFSLDYPITVSREAPGVLASQISWVGVHRLHLLAASAIGTVVIGMILRERRSKTLSIQ